MTALAVSAGLVDAVSRRLATDHRSPDAAGIAAAVRAEMPGVVDDARMVDLIRDLEQELTGCGPLTALLADPRTTDVVVNAPTDVRVDRGSGWEPTGIRFAGEAAVQRLARRLAVTAGTRLDDAHPYVDARLADGTRLHAVLPPIAAAGTYLSLRVLRPTRLGLSWLADGGMFPGQVEPVLNAIVAARLAFLVSGGTGTGKTTLLAALLSIVDSGERIVTVEDAEELRPSHPHVLRLVARTANVEGVGTVGMAELVRQALRMRPDRLVVGEVRGAEVVDLLAALSTGHDGGAGTVHANGAADVPARIAALAATGGLGRTAVYAQLASAVQIVVHLRRAAGVRRVAEIAVLQPGHDGAIDLRIAVADGRLVPDGAAALAALLGTRGVSIPW